jgi:hypothetical protein
MTNLQLELHRYETGDEEAKEGTKAVRRQIDNMGASAAGATLGRYVRMERGNLGLSRA